MTDKAASVHWERKDGGLYECRRRVLAVIECPRCGSDVECEAETEEWVLKRSKWRHNCYGPAEGQCCGLLLVDSWDGARAYELPGEAARGSYDVAPKVGR